MAALKSFVIIGGGASGAILAAQLLRSGDAALRVVLVDRDGVYGRGAAYSTGLDDHLLNVSARGMSAFPDRPDHFHDWLSARNLLPGGDTPFFAPRRLYGDYLSGIVAGLESDDPQRLRLVAGSATVVKPTGLGVEVKLSNGTSLIAHAVVLATGHDVEPAGEIPFAVRPGSAEDTTLSPDAPVLILGTGLSMVDTWLSLRAGGHVGTVTALSRRGLLPAPHRRGRPLILDIADVPLGTDLSYFVDWFRGLVREQETAGGNWRDVVDGLRPHNQRIWQSWSPAARRRFLEHSKAWWDIHRHRMAPAIHDRLTAAIAGGGLRPVAGRLVDATPARDGFDIGIQLRRRPMVERMSVARIYDCTGIVRDPASGSSGVIRTLIDDGQARGDPLSVGLDVTAECAVLDASGKASDRIFAIGPLTRGRFLEIDAVPEIRTQAAGLAARLTA